MKVIKRAPEISEWEYPHNCANCDSEVVADFQDLKYQSHGKDGCFPATESFSATCVVCLKDFDIPNEQVPKLFKSQLRDVYAKKQAEASKNSFGYWDR